MYRFRVWLVNINNVFLQPVLMPTVGYVALMDHDAQAVVTNSILTVMEIASVSRSEVTLLNRSLLIVLLFNQATFYLLQLVLMAVRHAQIASPARNVLLRCLSNMTPSAAHVRTGREIPMSVFCAFCKVFCIMYHVHQVSCIMHYVLSQFESC